MRPGRTELLRLKSTLKIPWLVTNEDSQALPELDSVMAGFLNLGTTDILSHSGLYGGCPVHYGMFGSILPIAQLQL